MDFRLIPIWFVGTLALAGCTQTQAAPKGQPSPGFGVAQLSPVNTQQLEQPFQSPAPYPRAASPESLPPPQTAGPGIPSPVAVAPKAPPSIPEIQSGAHCRRLLREEQAQAGILASPHAIAEVTNDFQARRARVGIGVEAADYVEAALIRRRSMLTCEHYALDQALASAEQYLNSVVAAAGFRARAAKLASAGNAITGVRRHIELALKRGDINISEATALRDVASGLEASRFGAQADAERLAKVAPPSALPVDMVARIARVETELAEIERKLRQTKAWKLTADVGVESFARSKFGEGSVPREGSGPYVQVRATYKLGTLAVSSYEAEAKSARYHAVHEEYSMLSQRLARLRASGTVYADAARQRVAVLATALAQATATFATLRRAGGDETTHAGLIARLSVIRFTAELGEAEAALEQAQRISQLAVT